MKPTIMVLKKVNRKDLLTVQKELISSWVLSELIQICWHANLSALEDHSWFIKPISLEIFNWFTWTEPPLVPGAWLWALTQLREHTMLSKRSFLSSPVSACINSLFDLCTAWIESFSSCYLFEPCFTLILLPFSFELVCLHCIFNSFIWFWFTTALALPRLVQHKPCDDSYILLIGAYQLLPQS